MLLEFEQPIVELEGKLTEMKQLAESSKVDVSEDVKSLEKKIEKLKEVVEMPLLHVSVGIPLSFPLPSTLVCESLG